MKFTGKIGRKQTAESFIAFNNALHSRVRGKTGPNYAHIPSGEVLAAVYSVAQSRGLSISEVLGSATGRLNTRHVIRIRFDGLKGTGQDQYFPELVLYNSYDGEQSLRLSTGMFRLICSNGLTIGEGITEHTRVRHVQGPAMDFRKNLEYQIAACIDALVSMESTIARLKGMTLPATVEQGITDSLKLSKRMTGQLSLIRSGAAGRDSEQNLWAYYNAVNEVLRKGSRSAAANEFRNMNLLSKLEETYANVA